MKQHNNDEATKQQYKRSFGFILNRTFCFFICFFVSGFAHARYDTVIKDQVIKSQDIKKARRQAVKRVTDAITFERIQDEIGKNQFQENKKKIYRQIRPLKDRFIPFFKILESKKEKDSYRFKVEVRFSERDLRLVLKEKGFFMDDTKAGIALPFIEFNNLMDRKSYIWWSPASGKTHSEQLKPLAHDFEEELYQGFSERGFFMLRPQAFKMVHMVPKFMRKAHSLTHTEMVQLTGFKKGQFYLDGQVSILASPLRKDAYRIQAKIKCRQTSNTKVVAEVVTFTDTASGKTLSQITGEIKDLALKVGRDLAGQVYDLWQRGGLDAQVLKLTLIGDLSHQQTQKLKKLVSNRLGIRSGLTERLLEPGRVTFEMDYAKGLEEFVRQLKKSKFKGFMVQPVFSHIDQVVVDVKAVQ